MFTYLCIIVYRYHKVMNSVPTPWPNICENEPEFAITCI